MAIAFKPAKTSRIDVRRDALRALVVYDSGRSNLDLINQGFLKSLPKAHRPFYTELTKGTVRNLGLIDYKLEKILERPLDSLTPWIRNVLRLGGYQLEFMNTPKPIAVNAMVELAKRYGHSGTAKLVNGALRKWAGGYSPPLPEDLSERLSISYSHPLWLVKRWLPRFGEKETEDLLAWNNTLPTLEVRLNSLRITSAEFKALCRENGILVTPTPLEDSFVVDYSGPMEKFPGFSEGLFWIQGLAAQLPVYLLDPKPGEILLDLCAAPGGKSCQLAAITEDNATVISVDKNAKRLQRVEENRRRLGIRSITLLAAEGELLQEIALGAPDAILLDAPCSATGVFRREVDARWNKSPDDFKKYSKQQLALLTNAARLLKPGGRLVYSTCSLEPEENEEVLKAFLDAQNGFSLEDPLPCFPKSMRERLSIREKTIRILPQRDALDGFFMAKLRKTDERR